MPASLVQLRFGCIAEETVDRVPGNIEFAKTMEVLLPVGSVFKDSCFSEFGEQYIAKLKMEYDNVNCMLEHEEILRVSPSRSPSPQASRFRNYFVL